MYTPVWRRHRPWSAKIALLTAALLSVGGALTGQAMEVSGLKRLEPQPARVKPGAGGGI